MQKEKNKFFRRKIGVSFLKFFVFLNSSLPLSFSYFLGKILGIFACFVIRRHRRRAFNSLSIAFPKLSVSKRKKVIRDFFVFMVQGSFELLYYLKNLKSLSDIRIEGAQHLKEALAKGQGVIMVTAHLGNFPLMSLKLARAGFPTYIVARQMRDEQVGNYLHILRTKAGVGTILSYPRRECIGGILNALRANSVVIMQMDQNFGTGGVWVKFFNRLAATPTGPIVLSLRTKAKIVPAYIYRDKNGINCVKILQAKELIVTDDKDETNLLNAIELTKMIEDWVKDIPYQWGWIHRRWKSRPSDKFRKMKFKIQNNL